MINDFFLCVTNMQTAKIRKQRNEKLYMIGFRSIVSIWFFSFFQSTASSTWNVCASTRDRNPMTTATSGRSITRRASTAIATRMAAIPDISQRKQWDNPTERFTDLCKQYFPMVVWFYVEDYFQYRPVVSKNTAWFKRGQNRPKNNHLDALI